MGGAVEQLEYRLALSATPADPTLIADINKLPYGLPVNSPGDFVTVGSTVFFTASDATSGVELWKTDGTVAGTKRVADINPGVAGSSPSALVAFKGSLYFTADDGTNGRELWKSDGTAAGTVMVKDVSAGPQSGLGFYGFVPTPQPNFGDGTGGLPTPGQIGDGTGGGPTQGQIGGDSTASLVVANNLLFFVGLDNDTGSELWKSDGTSAGTVLVRDVNAVARLDAGTQSANPDNLTAVGTTLYFTADDGVHGTELWKSDGSLAGTVLVADINSAVDTSDPTNPIPYGSAPSSLTNLGGTLYFTAYDDDHGVELWKSTGTTAGTVLVKDIVSGPDSSEPGQLTAVGTTLYFTANDGASGRELWKSTGTAAGTTLVRDINRPIDPDTGLVFPADSEPQWLTAVGSTLYFSADDGVNGRELWKSTGTAAGTVMVKDIDMGVNDADGSPLGSNPQWLTNVGGKLYFTASYSPSAPFYTVTTIWKSDGTAAGTLEVSGNDDVTLFDSPAMLTPVGNTVYFAAAPYLPESVFLFSLNTATGKSAQILAADPSGKTADGIYASIPYSEQGDGSGNALPDLMANEFVPFNGAVYFAANNGATGYELWKSDGTAAGTAMVKDILPGSDGSYPYGFTVVGSTLFFVASGAQGEELWKTDGTAAGTVQVKDIASGVQSSYPADFTPLGGTLYFTADDGKAGRELWKSNGTAAGTVMVKNIRADVPASPSAPVGSGSYLSASSPEGLTVRGTTLYFSADDGIHGRELWQSDGTPTGTKLAVDVDEMVDTSGSASYAFSGVQSGLTLVGNTLFFAGQNADTGSQLWKSDGTPEGTMPVSVLAGGIGVPTGLTPVGDNLFFTRGGEGLFVSDGFEEGTQLLTDVLVIPDSLTAVGNSVYFIGFTGQVYDFAAQSSLWRSDGTVGGTEKLFDGTLLDPKGLRAMFGSLYFTARDAVTGVRSLYAVDPTSTAGYSLIVDGTTFQTIAPIRGAFGTVVFGADNGQTGLELWKADAIGDKPTVTFGIDRTAFKKGDTATVTFTLSEASTGFTASDVTVTGGSLSNFKGSGASYTATFTPTAQFIGAGTISVPSGGFLGVEGLANAAGALTDPLQIDTADPRVTITSDRSALKAGEKATITFSLNKDSDDFTADDVTATGGSLSEFTKSSGSSYSATFTPSASSMVAGAISVAAGKFTDAAGNASVAGTLPAAIKIDTVVPTITITSDKSSLKIGETATLTFTLSETLTGFSLAGVAIGGGTLSTPAGSGLKYTAKFMPFASSTADGTVTIAAAAGTDAAGNPTLAASLNPAIKIDTAAPTVTITSSVAALKAGDTATITFRLSEDSANFQIKGEYAQGGTLSGLSGSGSVYTAKFTPTPGSTTPGKITIPAAKFTDAAGNPSVAGSLSTPISIDTVVPTLKISSSKASLKSGETSSITFALSEPSNDFDGNAVSVTGGALSNFIRLTSTSYSADFSPTNGFTGTAGVVVAAAKFTDAAGNPNVAGSLAPTALKIDTAAPTLTISTSTTSLNKAGAATITVKLSEASTTFNASTVKLVGGTLSGFSGKGDTYTFKFVPAANFVGTGTVSVATAAFSDVAGNPNVVGSSLSSDIAIDTVVPTLSISSDKSSLKAGETATITFQLSEDSNNFFFKEAFSGVKLDGGVLSNFSGSKSIYTATFTPKAGSTAPGKITVGASAFTDAAGNPSLAGSLPTPLTINTVQPIVKITSEKTALKAGETTKITFAVSETVTDFAVGDIQVTGGSLSAFTGTGKSYSAVFTPTASSVADGVISIAAGGLTNAAGNTNPVASLAAAIKIDTAVPTILITSDLSTLTAGKTAKITFSLSEASTNFVAGDVTVTNGTLSAFAGSGTTYTATFTPKAAFSGTGRISVAAGKFTDKAGNNSLAGELADAITINTLPST